MNNDYEISKEFIGNKRNEYSSNDEACMLTAFAWASRSKDPSTQVGACFVNENNKIISVGYNGAPNGWDDDSFPWRRPEKGEGEYNSKYPYVIHAEMNGVLNYDGPGKDFRGSTCFVTLFPCAQCAKFLVQRGIKRVVYYTDDRKDTEDNKCAKRTFTMTGVEFIDFHDLMTRRTKDIEINLDEEKGPIKIKRKEDK
ncbi:MAG: dCMP deaminase family protein [Bacilli bacterium]|nr:dCMP deaminase family protein [Bacilli bacterium]